MKAIRVDVIPINDTNPARLNKLKKEMLINKRGPILHAVYDKKENVYVLLNGSHRAQAAKELNYTIKLIIHKNSKKYLYEIKGLTKYDCGGTFYNTISEIYEDRSSFIIKNVKIKILKTLTSQ